MLLKRKIKILLTLVGVYRFRYLKNLFGHLRPKKPESQGEKNHH